MLVLFIKYYNKWFVHVYSKTFMWEKNSNNIKIVARKIHKDGNSLKEVESEKYGHWGTQSVFYINPMSEVLSVGSKLGNEF